MVARPAGGGASSLTACSSSSSAMDGGSGEQNGGEVCECVWGGAGVSERINGSHYMVLTVWPGHGVMDVLWQVMVLCCLRLSKRR